LAFWNLLQNDKVKSLFNIRKNLWARKGLVAILKTELLWGLLRNPYGPCVLGWSHPSGMLLAHASWIAAVLRKYAYKIAAGNFAGLLPRSYTERLERKARSRRLRRKRVHTPLYFVPLKVYPQ
jgi:hypothetical protein